MGLRVDALRTLEDWQAPDPDQERLRRRFTRHLHDHEDALERGCFPAHLTASTLVLSADRRHVLLTLHAKAKAWFQLGGHCEPADDTLAGAAAREAAEESGLTGLRLDPRPVHLDAHDVSFCHPAGTVAHLDVRFVATAPTADAHVLSEESLALRWWPVDDLPTPEPTMRRLTDLALGRTPDP